LTARRHPAQDQPKESVRPSEVRDNFVRKVGKRQKFDALTEVEVTDVNAGTIEFLEAGIFMAFLAFWAVETSGDELFSYLATP
jgi:hypothetical protein